MFSGGMKYCDVPRNFCAISAELRGYWLVVAPAAVLQEGAGWFVEMKAEAEASSSWSVVAFGGDLRWWRLLVAFCGGLCWWMSAAEQSPNVSVCTTVSL